MAGLLPVDFTARTAAHKRTVRAKSQDSVPYAWPRERGKSSQPLLVRISSARQPWCMSMKWQTNKDSGVCCTDDWYSFGLHSWTALAN